MPSHYQGYTSQTSLAEMEGYIRSLENRRREKASRYNEACDVYERSRAEQRSSSTIKKAKKQCDKWREEIDEVDYRLNQAIAEMRAMRQRESQERTVRLGLQRVLPAELQQNVARYMYDDRVPRR